MNDGELNDLSLLIGGMRSDIKTLFNQMKDHRDTSDKKLDAIATQLGELNRARWMQRGAALALGLFGGVGGGKVALLLSKLGGG